MPEPDFSLKEEDKFENQLLRNIADEYDNNSEVSTVTHYLNSHCSKCQNDKCCSNCQYDFEIYGNLRDFDEFSLIDDNYDLEEDNNNQEDGGMEGNGG